MIEYLTRNDKDRNPIYNQRIRFEDIADNLEVNQGSSFVGNGLSLRHLCTLKCNICSIRTSLKKVRVILKHLMVVTILKNW